MSKTYESDWNVIAINVVITVSGSLFNYQRLAEPVSSLWNG